MAAALAALIALGVPVGLTLVSRSPAPVSVAPAPPAPPAPSPDPDDHTPTGRPSASGQQPVAATGLLKRPPARRPANPPAGRPRQPGVRPPVPVNLAFEAESSQHRSTTGITRPRDNDAASGGWVIGWVGNGSGNTLRESVTVPDTAKYAVTLYYISATSRQAVVRVNNGPGLTVNFPPTGDWDTVRALTLRLTLRAGGNTILIGNPDYWAPDIDRIAVTR